MLHHLRTRAPFILGLTVFFIGIFVAEKWGLYYTVPNLDKVLHTLGGLAVAWMAMAILQDDIRHLLWHKQLLLIISITALVGIIWEFAEYAAGLMYSSWPWLYHWFHGGDMADTIGDLIADLSGGMLFAAWALWKERN